jgi:hypothetical protein
MVSILQYFAPKLQNLFNLPFLEIFLGHLIRTFESGDIQLAHMTDWERLSGDGHIQNVLETFRSELFWRKYLDKSGLFCALSESCCKTRKWVASLKRLLRVLDLVSKGVDIAAQARKERARSPSVHLFVAR